MTGQVPSLTSAVPEPTPPVALITLYYIAGVHFPLKYDPLRAGPTWWSPPYFHHLAQGII